MHNYIQYVTLSPLWQQTHTIFERILVTKFGDPHSPSRRSGGRTKEKGDPKS